MKISARNQLKGIVKSVDEGAVNSVIALDVDGEIIKSDITLEATKDLGLKEGKEVFVIIKASNVMVAASDKKLGSLSARNQLSGKVASVKEGAVNGIVSIELGNGQILKSSITNEAIKDLSLSEGDKVLGVVKSNDVMLAVE